jgi:hypothetical protein
MIEQLQQDAAIKEFSNPNCGKFLRIFGPRCGYFPNKFIRLAHTAVKTLWKRCFSRRQTRNP